MPDFEAKAKLREQMEAKLAPFKVVAAAWTGGVMLGEGCDDDAYTDLVGTVANTGNLPWRFENERLREMIGKGLGAQRVYEDSYVVSESMKASRYPAALPWDLTFPEVFSPAGAVGARAGFDVVIGNPPWDAIRRSDDQFFGSIDFEALAGATKPEKRLIQRRILQEERHQAAYDAYVKAFQQTDRVADALYEVHQARVHGDLAGRGTYDYYMLFAERAAHVLARNGTVGWVMPSGFHANEGATGVRRLYLNRLKLKVCFSFENRRQLFEIHRSFKFALVIADSQGPTSDFLCGFYLHDQEWLFADHRDPQPLKFSIAFVRATGGEYLSFVELRSTGDQLTADTIFRNGVGFDSFCRSSHIKLSQELNRTYDSHRFTSLLQVLNNTSDSRDPQIAAELFRDGWLVLHEGKSFHQFTDAWGPPPKYLVKVEALADRKTILRNCEYLRLAYREISASTNERTAIFDVLPAGVVFSNKAPADQSPSEHPTAASIELMAIGNSFVFDFGLRLFVSSSTVNYFYLARAPIPVRRTERSFLIHSALRLLCSHAGYATLWREQLGDVWREEKPLGTWPVLDSEDESWKVRATIDAVVADEYGLPREQYDHVLASFSHKSYLRAPELCLARFDELKAIGIEAFTRKYDPYWDIPLNENLPAPVISIPMLAPEDDAQHTLTFTDDAPAHSGRRTASTNRNGGEELYKNLRELLAKRHQITNADAQSALACTAAQARTILKRLVEERYAVIEGRGRSTRYVAVSSTEVADAHPAGRPN